MRIAIIAEVYLPKIDGVVIRTLNLIRELRAAGDEVLVICPQVSAQRDSPVPVVDFVSFPFPMYPEYRIGQPDERLTSAVREFRPDVIHFLNPFAFGFQCYDILSSSSDSIPTVFSFHTLYAEFVKRYGVLRPLAGLLWWLTRTYHNKADVNLTVSAIMRKDLIARDFDRVELWQPAVDTDLYHPERRCPRMRSRLAGPHEKKYQLLTVSRLAPEKNVEFLADVLKQVPDASLTVIGDGPHRAALEAHFAALPVNFVGYLQGQELAQAYASADAFLYASETETMGNVILESMAAGLPVVAPRAGGIPSLVTHEQSGLLFSPGDAATATAYTKQVLCDEDCRKTLVTAAREFACRHRWHDAAMRVRSDYQKAIERAASRKSIMTPTSRTARITTQSLVSAFRLVSAYTNSAESTTVTSRTADIANTAVAADETPMSDRRVASRSEREPRSVGA